jgi:citrate synthase
LLLTGEVPTDAQVKGLQKELHDREDLPDSVVSMIDSLPKDMHPMSQLSIGLMGLQQKSQFAEKYREGINKQELWKYSLQDSIDIVAKMPTLTARIFRNVFFDGQHIPSDKSLDWAGNYAHMMGVADGEGFKDITRLYLMLHADHEGGNVSAHATHLVGSALADPYLSFVAGVNGLAGPLHGLANQECLRWLKDTKKSLGDTEPTVENITQLAKDTLAAGKVIPGFGHGALRITDPRYIIQREFAQENFPDDPLFKLANTCFEAIPPVLAATGKVKSPWPNVDALSGCCMAKYGLTQEDYYTVVFAVSRSIGCTASLVWSRVMGLPIERPKSVNLEKLAEMADVKPVGELSSWSQDDIK